MLSYTNSINEAILIVSCLFLGVAPLIALSIHSYRFNHPFMPLRSLSSCIISVFIHSIFLLFLKLIGKMFGVNQFAGIIWVLIIFSIQVIGGIIVGFYLPRFIVSKLNYTALYFFALIIKFRIFHHITTSIIVVNYLICCKHNSRFIYCNLFNKYIFQSIIYTFHKFR